MDCLFDHFVVALHFEPKLLVSIFVVPIGVTFDVPQAIRDLAADACMNGGNYADISNSKSSSCIAINRPEENRHAAATALALAAVVSGLTSSPEELSAKHKANRSARAAAASAAGQTAGSSAETSAGQRSGEGGAVATLAMQKVRDYQLQVFNVLFCVSIYDRALSLHGIWKCFVRVQQRKTVVSID